MVFFFPQAYMYERYDTIFELGSPEATVVWSFPFWSQSISGLAGFFPIHPMSYMAAKRNRQKAAAKEAEEKAAAEGKEAESSTSWKWHRGV